MKDIQNQIEELQKQVELLKKDQPKEGINICVETIQRLKELEGVRGFHIMAIEWEEMVPEIVERSGLYPRPKVE